MKRQQIDGTQRTRRFAPYASRKNMKRALGLKHHSRGTSTGGLDFGAIPDLIGKLIHRAASQRGR